MCVSVYSCVLINVYNYLIQFFHYCNWIKLNWIKLNVYEWTGLNLEDVAREADEVGTDAKPSAAAGRHGQSGHISIKNAKGGCSNEGNEADLVQIELALGDSVSSKGNQSTFNQIFNGAFDQLAVVKV